MEEIRTPKGMDFNAILDKSFENQHNKQTEFLNDMFDLMASDTDTDNVTCIPARCGVGKSKFIQAFIWACMKHKPIPIGMIVVTDSIRRLENFIESSNDKDDEWRGFLSRMQKSVAVLKSNDVPFKEQLLNQSDKPILLMSTQRYFMLDEDIRETLFYFKRNGKKYPRSRVIFDEKPYFTQSIDINISTLNKIDTALKNLDETVRSKKYLIREFQAFSQRLQDVMEEKENLHDRSLILYWKDEYSQNLTSNDTIFFQEIDNNKESLYDEYQDLLNLRQLMREGGIFYSQKKGDSNKYKKGFSILKDNKSFFYLGENKAKFFVFDATCDIDPVYDIDYAINIDCSKYDIPLNLKITNVSIPTTQNAICRGDKRSQHIIKATVDFLREEVKDDLLLVTYNKILTRFKKFFNHSAYFGNIKGFNDYKSLYNMAHIGLNRFSDLAYFLIYCSANPKVYERLKTFSEEESLAYFDNLFKNRDNYIIQSIMVKTILADFEQNIFRLALRDFNNQHPVNIWTFYNNSYGCYKALSEAIEERYKPLNTQFAYLGEPLSYKAEKTQNRKPANNKEKTNPQKAIEFLTGRDEFTTCEFREHLDTTIQAVKRNESVKAEFDKFEKISRSRYRRIA